MKRFSRSSKLGGAWLRALLTTLGLGITILSLTLSPFVLPAAEPHQTGAQPPSPPQRLWNEPIPQDQKILHLLNRITFGPRPGDVQRVKEMGAKAYLDEQLYPERIDDSQVEAMFNKLPSYSMSNAELLADYPPPRFAKKLAPGAPAVPNRMEANRFQGHGEMRREARIMGPEGPQRVLVELGTEELWRAAYSNRQLQEVMVQFWMNHFNIFAGKGADRWLLTSFERDVIRPHALGKFQDLLVATAESPAMLFYLDNWMSSVANPEYAWNGPYGPFHGQRRYARVGGGYRAFGRRRGLGRIGFPQPGLARFPRQDRQRPSQVKAAKPERGLNENYGRELMELHTLGVNGGYTQQDVIEVARCLTGWTILRPRQGAEFIFNPRLHDYGPKVVLGRKIPAGHGMEDGIEVLHLLATSPATAHHISYELCQRFIADNPPESAVDRAAKTWLRTDGDIREVLRSILTSRDFYSQAAYHAKVKSPLELMASALRALQAKTEGGMSMLHALAAMGEPMFQYQAPSGYYDRASTWVNSGALLMRMNFATLLASDRIPGTRVNLNDLVPTSDDRTPERMIEQIAERVLGEPPSAATEQAILKELAKQGSADAGGSDARLRVETATIAGLLIGSPDFQRR